MNEEPQAKENRISVDKCYARSGKIQLYKSKSFSGISPETKEQMIKEIEQLRKSIIYDHSYLHFFWQHETLVSHYRYRVYSLWDMIGKETTYISSFIIE